MNKAASLIQQALDDVTLRWGAGAAALFVWVAIAWADPRVLVALPLVAGTVAFVRRRRGPVPTRDEEFDDWL